MDCYVVSRACFALGGWKAVKTRPCTAACGVRHQPPPHSHSDGTWRSIKNLVKSCGGSTCVEDALNKGQWVKLICGASFEDVADVRNLSLVYTLAGVDCIDCAADDSVVTAVNEGIDMAEQICMSGETDEKISLRRPWVMISVNDDKDIHFRKAQGSIWRGAKLKKNIRFLKTRVFEHKKGANTYIRTNTAVIELIQRSDVDAIEIHTSAGHLDSFKELWSNLSNFVKQLKLVAVSLPNLGDSTIESLNAMYSIMKPFLRSYNLWQLDGRPMSGDIGKGATMEAVAFAAQVAATRNRPPGFLQLAGGTNSNTIESLKRIGLFRTASIPDCGMESENPSIPFKVGKQFALIAGVAYGGYARKVVGRVLSKMYNCQESHIEHYPHFLLEALEEAAALVGPIKGYALHSPLDG